MSRNINLKFFVLCYLIVLFFTGNSFLYAQDTVKIMSWNLLNYTVSETERNEYYKTVIGSVAPDIFVCQEVADGQAAVDSFYKNVIQQILPEHAKGLFVNGTDTDNAIFYNSALFTFVSNTPIRTALRDITEFKLIKTSSGDTLRIYSVHLKASSGADNELLRAKEVDSLRKVTNLIPAGANFFVCGDFNLYNSNEAAYQKLILDNAGDDGNFIDPIIMPISSNWNNASNAAYHTQSPRVRQFGGGSTGGMDDRFDLMLFSNAIFQTGGMFYVPNSFVAYGNDGNHYNDSINSLPNTAVSTEVANAIHYAADHLPIYAKFTFPASVTAPTAQATNLQFSSITTTSITGNFTAASPAADGYLVLRKAGSAPASIPVNGNAYTAGGTLGDAIVAYSGTGTTFANTGLSSGVTYYLKIFSFNGSGSSSAYLTTNPLSGAQATNSATPALTISASSLTFSNTEINTSSAVQSFTVSGSNLAANIVITPPVDFQISTNSGSGFISNPSTIVLTPSSGTVASTTIYARFSPLSASGSMSDSIMISSTGATSGKVQVSGVSISTQPTQQPAITVDNETAGSVIAHFTGGNGTKRILIMRSGAAVDYVPVDATPITGVSSNFSSASDLGNGNKAVYDGNSNTVTITGLSGATQYYFAVYEYNAGTNNSQNYLTTSPGIANYTTGASNIYTWGGGNGSFAVAANWVPSRTVPSGQDVLRFNAGDSVRVTDITSQSIGQLVISNSTKVVLAAAVACSLTVAGSAGTDLIVEAGSSLHVRGTNTLSILLSTGSSGSISGTFSMDSASHRLLSVDTGSLLFTAGATCIHGNPNSSLNAGNPFGTTNLNSVVFQSGSSFVFYHGSNPFGAVAPSSVVVFQPGSWFRFGRVGTSAAFSGRTYANIDLNVSGYSGTAPGGSSLSFDTLYVRDGSLNFTLTGGINVKNVIIVEGNGVLSFNPTASATLQFNGSTPQSIGGTGTLNFGSLVKFKLNNAAGLMLYKDLVLQDSVTITNGLLDLRESKLTLGATAKINPGLSATNMITATDTGEIRKEFSANGTFVFPVGGNGIYAPVSLTLNANGGLSSAYIGVRPASNKHVANYANTDYLNRSWEITGSGITSPDYSATFTYGSSDVAGNESNLFSGFWDGSKWTLGSAVNNISHQFSFNNLTSFGGFSAASSDFVGGASLLNIKTALQGYYNENMGVMNSSDTVKAYLTATVAPYAVQDSSSAVLEASNLTALFRFRNITPGSYNVYLRHRNSIETWLASAIACEKGTYTSIDATVDSSVVFGNNLVKVGSIWCIYSGDVNQDGFVDFSDLTLIDNDAYVFTSGYVQTDLNGDEFVDFSDLTLCDNNAYNFVGVIRP